MLARSAVKPAWQTALLRSTRRFGRRLHVDARLRGGGATRPRGGLRASSTVAHNAALQYDLLAAMDRKTSIICTIGPASAGSLRELLLRGMNVLRLNFSHGDH